VFWISKPTIEAKIARAFGYEYCTLFDSARSAIRTWANMPRLGNLPSNVCPVLWETMLGRPKIIAVDPRTGLAGVGVHLYGYRDFRGARYEIDPLMTGYLCESRAEETVISFGRKKMLDVGAGGALLSNTKPWFGYFPEGLRRALEDRWWGFHWDVLRRWDQIDLWDRHLGDSCVRIPAEQLMPWRVMRRIPDTKEFGNAEFRNAWKQVHGVETLRDALVRAIRKAGHPVGTNYPPLPGVTDPGAIQWGKEVINFFPDSDAKAISEIVKRTVNG